MALPERSGMFGWGRRSTGPGVTAFIDEGCEFDGRCAFSGTVMLNGRFAGEISGSDTLIIGDKARVTAEVRGGSVLVSGEVVGNISAAERVELRRPARVFGDITAPVLSIEEGVLFEGQCRMSRSSPQPDQQRSREGSVVALKR